MNAHRIFAAALVLFALTTCAGAQSARSEYRKGENKTFVETGLLYLLNTPEQFVEAQFTTAYKGEKLVKSADKITVTLFSISKKPLYRLGAQLIAVVDGERLKLGFSDPAAMTGKKAQGGEEAFFNERGIGMQIPVPASAKVTNARGIEGLTMEFMVFSVKPEVFAKIAEAKRVEFRLGDTPLALTEGQMNIVRDFASRLKPQA